MPINRQDARPLGAQIADDLRRRIMTEAQGFGVGKKIPSLRALADEYGVAELTVHAAVKQLQHEGVLESTSGRGTFVRAKPADGELTADASAVLAELRELRDEVAALRSRVEAVEQATR
ncbi:GntR family transcriptional regulator [Saccharothrix deserti]|uniref:GntR family transcriptional regulator n=1 Tax=Saccharothrix deserti TaxID=2593674 RepID=UPI00131A6CA1|nr:GntR family transcriptional regulator [Saccharothrix deserti]